MQALPNAPCHQLSILKVTTNTNIINGRSLKDGYMSVLPTGLFSLPPGVQSTQPHPQVSRVIALPSMNNAQSLSMHVDINFHSESRGRLSGVRDQG